MFFAITFFYIYDIVEIWFYKKNDFIRIFQNLNFGVSKLKIK